MSKPKFNKKYMTSWQEEKHTEQEISAFIKKAERYWSGRYESHTLEHFFSTLLNKKVWLLGVVVLKKKQVKR